MWIQKQDNGKFKYFERYIDPYTEKNKTVTVTLKSDSNSAKKEANRLLLEKIDEKLRIKDNNRMTLQELLDEWWEQYQKGVKNTSIVANRKPKRVVEENLEMDSLIKNIDTKLLQKFFNSLDYSYEYSKKIRGILNMAFNYALDMEYLENSPVTRTKIISKPNDYNDFKSPKEKFLDKEEMNRLLEAYYSAYQSIRMGNTAEFMYLTGMRFGEVIALKEDNYDKDEGTIDINGTLDYSKGYDKAVKSTTKTKASNRTIYLSNRAIEILETIIEENKKYEDINFERYIFVGKTGKPIQLNAFNQSLKDTNDKLGDKKINKKLSSHTFRHSHISLLAEMNLPIKSIMERVGHTDEKITLQIYTHVSENQRINITNKMNDLGL